MSSTMAGASSSSSSTWQTRARDSPSLRARSAAVRSAAPLAAWLVELGLALRDELPGFADLLERAQHLHFEWPMVGLVDGCLLQGRADLVVELPDRHVAILDFKAGSRFATRAEIPHIHAYAGQLDAYRRIVTAAGYEVDELSLLFVRGPSWVRLPVG